MVTLYIFIDASNLWEAQKAKGRFFDYEKLRNFLKQKYSSNNSEVFFYTAYPADGTRDYKTDGKHKFYTFLKKNLNFKVRKKELKRIPVHTDFGDIIKEKGNMDVEITIDMVHNVKKYDIAILFSGDSDFLALVNYVKSKGKKVCVYSSRNNISEELRTGADGYTDVLQIKEDIWGKELQHRNS